MAVNNIIKRIQNIMRQDAGINGDAQRIEQMTWMFFLWKIQCKLPPKTKRFCPLVLK